MPTNLAYHWERCNANGRAARRSRTRRRARTRSPGQTSATRCSRSCRRRTARRSRTRSAPRPRQSSTARSRAPPTVDRACRRRITGRRSAARRDRPGIWSGVGPIVVRLPLVPLRRERRPLHARSRARPRTCTRRSRRTSGETIGLTLQATDATGSSRVREPRRPGRGSDAALSPTSAADDLGDGARRRHADVGPGTWSPEPTGYAYDLASLQRERPALHADPRRDAGDVPAGGCRRRATRSSRP